MLPNPAVSGLPQDARAPLYRDLPEQSQRIPGIFVNTLRTMHAGGDHIHSIQGLLSGTVNRLFAQYDYRESFCDLLNELQQRGLGATNALTELSGDSVRGQLLLLARAAGITAELNNTHIVPALPAGFGAVYPAGRINRDFLNRHFSRLAQLAAAQQKTLRYVARIDAGGHLGCALVAVAERGHLGTARPGNRVLVVYSAQHRDIPRLLTESGARDGGQIPAQRLRL